MNTNPSIYTDIQSTSKLRLGARKDPGEALEGVARQFESMFVQMMLKQMREANLGEGLFESRQTEFYQDMYDKQLSTQLSSDGQGIGIADMLIRQLQDTIPKGEGTMASGALPGRQAFAFERIPAKDEIAVNGDPASFESPEAFVRALWPHAQRAAGEMGVDPKALVAQAALETGWGKAVIRRPDGQSSHNLFNIKADSRWEGERVNKQTLEYRDGVAVKEGAAFRAYDSYAESFVDYVRFLQDNPRYSHALRQGSDTHAFIRGLKDAGYATDPAYAEKINAILKRDVLAMQPSDKGVQYG